MTKWYQALLDRQNLREELKKKKELKKDSRKFSYVRNATPSTSSDNRSFPSKLERDVYELLLQRQKLGEIKDLQCQIQVHLTKAKILYKPDFKYFNCVNEQTEYAEAKGFETNIWNLKKRLWKFYGPAKLFIYKASGKIIVLSEIIEPQIWKTEDETL